LYVQRRRYKGGTNGSRYCGLGHLNNVYSFAAGSI
jgi:hypothetical protein